MKVYERMASAFAAEGVSHVFGMMGDGNMHWIDALDEHGVKMLEVRHEGFGAGMADGWARATRMPGVCTATRGPGVTQLATALVTASRARSPLVAFVGEVDGTDLEHAQYLDQARFAAACESGFVRVASPDTADADVRRAFYLAKLESRPIVLSAPGSVQEANFDEDEPYQPSSTLLSAHELRPDLRKLEAAADFVARSRKPVIVVGQGAKWSGAGDSVLRLAKRIGALIGTSLQAKGWLNDDEYHIGISGFYGTRTSMQLFEEADCVIAVGASMNRHTTANGYLYPKARFVHFDLKQHVLMVGGRSADHYLQADARIGVDELESLLAERSVKLTGYRTPEVKARLVHQFEDHTEFPIEPGCVDPRLVCLALDEIMPAHIGLATGGGSNPGFSNLLFNRPRSMVLGGHYFSCIGQMLPAAMGAILAMGNKPMLLVDGDASTMMHFMDFDAAVRYQIPLLAVVLNDQALGSEYHKMGASQPPMKAALAAIPSPDLGAVATALGGRGRLARSVEEVRAAAKEWVANPGPMVIDVRTSRNVLTLPLRRILYAKDE